MNKLPTPIVVVAYNRPRSLSRLLDSLKSAKYPSEDINLIISIDKADSNEDVLSVANEFTWHFGKKSIVYQKKNLGLRAHILKCGNISIEYGSVIVLEDDLYVSPNFYLYAVQALNFSENKSYIGGISLYNHQLNVHTRDNFTALEDGYDNWYFQFASSWGQAWSKHQWSGFMKWYEKNNDISINPNIPANVRSWSAKSWLKYNIAYLIEKEYYFLYPKVSLTTNFSDAGTHIGHDSTIYQVPLTYSNNKSYIFSQISESKSVYDAFYENMVIAKKLKIGPSDLTVDLFGYKKHIERRYLLSSRILDFKISKTFGKSLKPLDANIFQDISGNEFFLYDTQYVEKNHYKKNFKRNFSYNIRHIGFSDAFKVVVKYVFDKYKRGIIKLLGK